MKDSEKAIDAQNMALKIIGHSHDDPCIISTLTALLYDWKYYSNDKKKTISEAAKRIAKQKHKK